MIWLQPDQEIEAFACAACGRRSERLAGRTHPRRTCGRKECVEAHRARLRREAQARRRARERAKERARGRRA